MTIFIREMKDHRKSLIIWSIAMLFMVASGMAKFSYYAQSGQSMTDLIATMPKTLRAVFGFGDFDVTKASGFYGLLYIYLAMMVTIHAVMLGAGIIAKEERDKTTEFLMVKPVSRTRIITSKLLAALSNVVILNVVTLILSIVVVGKYSKGENITSDILVLMLGMFILQLIFLFLGTAVAAVSKNAKISGSISATILLVTYILSILADMNNNLKGLKYITPYKYFDAAELIKKGALQPAYVALSLVIIAVMVSITYIFYKKRDLNI